ncbi:MAG: MBL fold metallo-hydrolase [Planctomycetota bacterium]
MAPSDLQVSEGSGVLVLGVAQDGGRPQLGCSKDCCSRLSAADAEPVASLAVFGESEWVLIDATPDLTEQIAAAGSMPSAIVLTHAHIGHYLGLAHLGREVMGAERVPVWCSERMASFLRSNGPWSQLVELGNIELMVFEDEVAFSPLAGVTIRPLAVPHRDEYSDTFGFSISVRGAGVLYIPDIDSWEAWGSLVETAAQHDVALLDATFFDDSELPGRDMSEIPHPRVPETMSLLAPLVESGELRVWFTHLNHTNPLWDRGSKQAQALGEAGFDVARVGMWVVPTKWAPNPTKSSNHAGF